MFYLSHWLVRVCEIELLSHMGINSENPYLVCMKGDIIHTCKGGLFDFTINDASKVLSIVDISDIVETSLQCIDGMNFDIEITIESSILTMLRNWDTPWYGNGTICQMPLCSGM